MGRKLVILLGPTAVGKTDYSLELARKYDSPIISCDSRQIYKEMTIGTAVPDASQLSAVKHFFIQDHSVRDLYTAGMYEIEALGLIHRLFDEGHDTLVMTGGSMFYIDAVCKGLDDIPQGDPQIRAELNRICDTEGPQPLAEKLRELDPESLEGMDTSNGQRLIRALEVCLTTGRPFSSFKTSPSKKRDFEIEKIGLIRDRDDLYGRINRRVVGMVDAGLINEVRSLNEFRNLTALQTVGYREVFAYLDSLESDKPVSLEDTVSLIQRNTRHYAKKQLTWWKRDTDIRWLTL